MLSRFDSLKRHVTLKNSKKYINFEFFCLDMNSTSQTRINAYTLILEKNFRICEREKKYLLYKNKCKILLMEL